MNHDDKKTNGGSPEQSAPQNMNILQYAYASQAAFSSALLENTGYRTMTTFWADLTIAEHYGAAGVRETYDRVCTEWRGNYKYFTEFVLCLNHKIWQHYKSNKEIAAVYDELWRAADKWAYDNFTGEAAQYYFEVTD